MDFQEKTSLIFLMGDGDDARLLACLKEYKLFFYFQTLQRPAAKSQLLKIAPRSP